MPEKIINTWQELDDDNTRLDALDGRKITSFLRSEAEKLLAGEITLKNSTIQQIPAAEAHL